MLNAIIVDDESGNRELLNDLLQTYCPTVKIVGEADSVKSALKIISDEKPNLVFLDIQMPKGNGFELLQHFDELFFDIIFITSFDKYAINAIKFSALDYLLKPINIEELKIAVGKAEKKIKRDHEFLGYKNLLHNINPQTVDKKMAVNMNNNTFYIKMSDVMYILADGNYSFLHMENGIKYHISKTLKEIEEFTEHAANFIRINKSIVINANNFSHYQKGEPYLLFLRNGENFEISRRKRTEVLDKLKSVT
jgi:two-component system LytT family response regulator